MGKFKKIDRTKNWNVYLVIWVGRKWPMPNTKNYVMTRFFEMDIEQKWKGLVKDIVEPWELVENDNTLIEWAELLGVDLKIRRKDEMVCAVGFTLS